ncbi:hypothetical protein GCK72_018086 [Caenorhabditis remanei]|uniref:Uncharacterized protein n=1 Tax=Caenorhabditis remanei TaxID=31234 RepID=A0A6A5GAG4_CAERE|nr:hypothetical protein GCK72_018086 [Caenorhabditis remanei]KAF1751532.1 hypothetical protein GCK72_018086 [Caenorhabditis remanei]
MTSTSSEPVNASKFGVLRIQKIGQIVAIVRVDILRIDLDILCFGCPQSVGLVGQNLFGSKAQQVVTSTHSGETMIFESFVLLRISRIHFFIM